MNGATRKEMDELRELRERLHAAGRAEDYDAFMAVRRDAARWSSAAGVRRGVLRRGMLRTVKGMFADPPLSWRRGKEESE